MLSFYTGFSSAFLLFLGVIWNKDGMHNILIKTFCIILAIWGLVSTLQLEGYIVKVSKNQIETKEIR